MLVVLLSPFVGVPLAGGANQDSEPFGISPLGIAG